MAVRIDKFLWAVRIFKTRSLATDACRNGKVSINGQVVKASRDVAEGDVIIIQLGIILKSIKVLLVLEDRVAAKLVNEYIQDLTSVEEYEKLNIYREHLRNERPKGTGRPTKKERREIENFLGD